MTLMGQPDVADVHVPSLVMPFAGEHAARQHDPDGYVRFRRKTLTRGVVAVIGFKREGGSEIQSLRFSAEEFTPKAARTWLEDHGFKAVLEEAVEKRDLPRDERDVGLRAASFTTLTKSSPERRYTLGIVYEPDVVDTQREFAKAEDIEKAAWSFMARLQGMAKSGALLLRAALRQETIDLEPLLAKGAGLDDEHLQVDDAEVLGTIVESYVAPVDMEVEGQAVKKGAWLLGVQWSSEMFAKIKKGERTGLSMYGHATREEDVT